jgi:putative hydrolase of the HAD superfamily
MPADQPRAVIFDIGRVLVRVDIGRAMKGFAENIRLSPEEIWSAIEKDPLMTDWQEGRISPADWHQHLNRKLGGSLSFEQFARAWNSALDPQPIHDDHTFELLAKQHKLGLLSNTDPIHVAHLESNFTFFRYFSPKARTYSCTVGASKPGPLIYREALRRVHARPGETVFVDDRPENVEAARNLGMTGIHYQSPERLISELESLGIFS